MSSSIFEKIFISQFGAIKPPWIHKDDFYKLPFNYCDRWCERCKLSGICRVYQKEKEEEKKFIKQGINPKSWQAAAISIKESFQEVALMLEKDLKELKIETTEEDDKKFELEEKRKDDLVRNNQLTRISKKLSYSLVKFIEDLRYYFLEEKPKAIEEPSRILTYYMFFFSVKIHRAIYSEIEEKEMKYEDVTFDSKNSAFLSCVSITKIISALKSISNGKNLHQKLRQENKKLISLFKDLKLLLDKRFNLTIL